MADNVAITPGTGATVAADDIGGVLHQRVKISLGADGTANDASAGAGAVGTGTQRVTLASDDPAVAKLTAAAASFVKLDDAAFASGNAVAGIGGVRDDALSTLTPAEGDWSPLRQTSTGALWVQDASLNANGQATMANSSSVTMASDQTLIGTGGNTVISTITMTADTSIMAAAEIIADTQQLDAAFRISDGTGVLQSMTVFDPDDNTAFAFDVYIHSTSTSMGTENQGITITDANAAAGILGVVSFTTSDAKDLINGRMYHKSNIGLPIKAASGTDDLYVSIVNGSGTPTFAGGSIPIRLGILRD
jgi:hypothetical protein